MLIIIALVIAALFVFVCGNALKKYPYAFYILAAALMFLSTLVDWSGAPVWFRNYILASFTKSTMGTALFIFVMYAGALPKTSRVMPTLMRLRGELSITAAILVLSHNITYGKLYFKMLFTAPKALPTAQLVAAIISVILLCIMIPLTIMSFMPVRRKMKPKVWKKIQRSAYAFYGLLYLHVMIINFYMISLTGSMQSRLNVAVYSVIFIGYGAMRVAKAVSIKSLVNAKSVFAAAMAGFVILAGTVSVFGAITPKKTINYMVYEDDWDEDEEDDEQENIVASGKTDSVESESKAALAENSTVSSAVASENVSDGTSENTSADASAGNELSAADNKAVAADTEIVKQEVTTTAAKEEATVARIYKADGTYTGTARCSQFSYNVTVSVVISGDSISSVTFTTDDSGANVEYISKASVMGNRIKKKQGSAGVDTVSGATYTSKSVLEAFDNAIQTAK